MCVIRRGSIVWIRFMVMKRKKSYSWLLGGGWRSGCGSEKVLQLNNSESERVSVNGEEDLQRVLP